MSEDTGQVGQVGQATPVIQIEAGRRRVKAGAGAAKVPVVKLASLPRLPKVKKPKPLVACACGCGMETRGTWVAGHDSRHRGWILRINRGLIKIGDPAITDGERAVLKKALASQSKGRKQAEGSDGA